MIIRQITDKMSLRVQRSGTKQSQGFEIASLRYRFVRNDGYLRGHDMSSLKQAQDKKTQTFTAILHWEEDVYVAECPEVGTASQGETIEEAIANLREATELYLDEFPLLETAPRFLLTTFEVTSA